MVFAEQGEAMIPPVSPKPKIGLDLKEEQAR
jgi:hypothetical protein